MAAHDVLEGLVVVDLGLGMAPAIASKLLNELGATVYRSAPASDPFPDIYPAYRAWRANVRELDLQSLDETLATADVCILGGESYPDLDWQFNADALSAANPRLVILRIEGMTKGNPTDLPAVEILVQARTGTVYEMFDQQPILFAAPLANIGAALQGLVATMAALVERVQSNSGQIIDTSLEQGLLTYFQNHFMSAEVSDPLMERTIPRDAGSPIFTCLDDKYILMAPTPASIDAVFDILDLDADKSTIWSKGYYGDMPLYEANTRHRERSELLSALWTRKVATDVVFSPEQCRREPQVAANGIIVSSKEYGKYVGCPLKISRVAVEVGASGRGGMKRAPSEGRGILQGVRVLDFGHFVAAPYTAELLVQLGADVIKVEPTIGEAGRLNGRRNVIAVNYGKRSLAVDLKTPAGKKVVSDLIQSADVVIHNFRNGVDQRLNLDAASLQALNPSIVTVKIAAFGTTGPKAAASGFDPVIQAYSGHAWRAGGENNKPLCYRIFPIDYSCGALCATAILASLFRQRLGSDDAIDIQTNLLNIGLFLLSELIEQPDGTFSGAPPLNHGRTGFHPAESLYETADGWIAVAARSPEMAARFADCLGLELGSRDIWGERERQALAERLKRRETKAALADLDAAGVWATSCVHDGWKAMQGSAEREDSILVRRFAHPRHRSIAMLGPLATFSRSPGGRPAREREPEIGEDSEDILRSLSYGNARIVNLLEDGIVKATPAPQAL
jgi:Predicted acyl-CoA transferases/carnitine dehydratase